MEDNVPLDSIFPACRYNIFFISTFAVLDGLDIDGGLPSVEECALFLFVVGVEEDEFVGVEEDGVLVGIPSVLLEAAIVTREHFIVVRPLRLFLSVKTVLADLTNAH
jgi:hypothetical protein